MAKRLLTECPYCHRKVSFFGASILKTKGEHCCAGCKCISNVVINKSIYGIASAVCVISFLILFLYSIFGDHGDPKGILFVFIPFLLFYIMVPFFVRLEPCKDKSAVKKLHRKISPIPEEKTEVIKEQPIELNVGDDFSSSFLKAKSSAKVYENEENAEKDDRIIEENEEPDKAASELDLDIMGIVNNPDEEIDADEVKIFDDSKSVGETPVQTTPAEELSDEEQKEIFPEESEEVSFIIGRRN